MGDKLLLGIDLGTGGCKITVIDVIGNIMAEFSEEYETFHPKPSWSEQNPGDWILALTTCLTKIRKSKNIDLKNKDT